jgi:hypothetical protein
MSWTTLAGPTVGRWGVVSSTTTTIDNGVDFVFRAREQYPLRVTDDRPLLIRDVITEP